MKPNLLSAFFVGACLGAGTLVGSAQDSAVFRFYRLGHMDGPHNLSKSMGISRDGTVAVGVTDVAGFMHAWRCDINSFLELWPVPPIYNEAQVQEDLGAVAPSRPSCAYAASDKSGATDLWGGSLPVGNVWIGNVPYACEWFAPEAIDGIPLYAGIRDFGGGLTDIQANDVSADGTILVGAGNNKRGKLAFRADFTDPLLPVVVPLTITDATTGQTLQTSVAEAVSADGLIIAGYGATKTGNRAFVTTSADFSVTEPTLVSEFLPAIDGGRYAEARAITPDGTIIAGRSDSPKGPQACIWYRDSVTSAWVVRGLGGLSKKKLNSVANSIAIREGSTAGELIVVGKSATVLYPEEAFVWTGSLTDLTLGYMYDLEYIMTKAEILSGEAGSEWILNEATGISADGSRIVGWGVNPEGGYEAWAFIDFPLDLVLTKEE